MSFVLGIKDFAWEGLDTEKATRHITKIGRVWEISACTFPAYEESSILVAQRSLDEAALESATQALERAKADEEAKRQELEEKRLTLKAKLQEIVS